MFYNYDIRNNGIEDILYLYITMKYEFANEFTFEDNVISASCNKFIRTNDIKFKGNKVCLVVDGKVTKCMYLNKNSNLAQEHYFVDNYMVNISLDDNSMCEITLRDYLLGVLMSKYMELIHVEALKAMTVLYTTFVLKMMEENNHVLASNRFAIYKPCDYLKADINNYEQIVKKLNNVIEETDGVYLSYNGEYILPFMHFSNSGKTLTNKNYPYLSSVKSLWDLTSPYYINVSSFSFDEINNKLKTNINNNTIIKITNNNFRKIKFGEDIFSLQEIENIFNLKSLDIYIIVNNDGLKFITRGFGNSYGLSLYGASEIARDGCKYYNILKYYFPKTKLYKKEIRTPK